MLYSSVRLFLPLGSLFKRSEKLFTALLVTAGVAASFPGVAARGSEMPVAFSQAQSAEANSIVEAVAHRPLENGVYLYGQSPEPEQVGAAYMVFQVTSDRVVGAFYMPQSSFDCFYGNVEAEQLALNVVDSYEQTTYPYSVAMATDSSVAMAGGEAIAPVGLEGFHRIQTVSSNDQRILETCQADYQRQQ